MNVMHQPYTPGYQPNVGYNHFAHYPQALAPPHHMHLPPPHPQQLYYQNPYQHFHPPPPHHYYNSYQPPQLHPPIYGQRQINEFTPQAGFSSPAQVATPVEAPEPPRVFNQELEPPKEVHVTKESSPEPVPDASPRPSLSPPLDPQTESTQPKNTILELDHDTGKEPTDFDPTTASSSRFHLVSFHPSRAIVADGQSSVFIWFRVPLPPSLVEMALPPPSYKEQRHPRRTSRIRKKMPSASPTGRFIGSALQAPTVLSKEGKLAPPEQESSSGVSEVDGEKDHQVASPAPNGPAKPSGKPATLVKSFASLLRGPQNDHSTNGDSRGMHTTTNTTTTTMAPQVPLTASAQIGFSIPALSSAHMDQGVATSLTPHQHANLLHLLKTGSGLQTTRFGTVVPGIPPQIVPRGLVNTGNLCFANAILQALVYTPPFWKLFNDIAATGLTAQRTGRAATPMVDATIAFLNEFKPAFTPIPVDLSAFPTAQAAASMSTPKPAINKPTSSRDSNILPRNSFTASELYNSLKSKPTFDGMRLGHQEDAEEFLGFFLDALHEELCGLLNALGDSAQADAVKDSDRDIDKLEPAIDVVQDGDEWQEVGRRNRATVTRTTQGTESAITAIFGGKFRSLLRASGRPDSASVEEWRCLQLDIQPPHIRSIEDALYALSAVETVTIQSHQGYPSEATKQMFVEHLPPILILHLKRFIYDPQTGIGKYGKQIRFAPELDVRSEMLSAASKHRPFSRKYQLYGVVYHHGLAATGGHYTLEVLHPTANAYMPARDHSSNSTEGWMRFDDETVRLLTPDDVFGSQAQPTHHGWAGHDERVAYILFYRRVGK
ncbi:Ubiquitin carboxyl-terminal hydrolase 10 {ECO:0000269/PubMed:20096447}; AltName: Full=Deubiquitinating enzyme 10; AltName: Full=Ubiquitin thioesterase 10; AltName: Full=Ubiquitin-specific-processing protease 10 [Serendipita indica DSM 11827]|nr:Ubiquitin carboxyl-terminal hydrolase 10 {ECO:0000269/PubMed:20096447}; AltName: Full=Deubiquitinating enzyme 10; AltName: Full=Ubiquitin thioesterase 10; AltName: Full=Ubiquitin-specific-processing protease 10 [Serendipita indica DSM 11827]